MNSLQEITELKSKIALAEAAAAAAQNESAGMVALQTKNSELALEVSTLQTNFVAEKLAKESAVADKLAAEKILADKSASIDAEIAKKVLEQTAALGGKTVKLDAQADVAKTATRAEFNKLNSPQQNEFFRAGGKITE